MEGLISSPEQPEILKILRKTRRFNTHVWPGGYNDQPHILLMELNAAIDIEIEHQEIIAYNALREANLKSNGQES